MTNEPTSAAHRHLPAPELVVADALREAQNGSGCGTSSLRNRSPERAAEVAIRALKLAGYRLTMPVCEACDNESGW